MEKTALSKSKVSSIKKVIYDIMVEIKLAKVIPINLFQYFESIVLFNFTTE
jgi:hypothetical protein